MSKFLVHDAARICSSDQIWESIPGGCPSGDDCKLVSRALMQLCATDPSDQQVQWPLSNSRFGPALREEFHFMGFPPRKVSAASTSPAISREFIPPLANMIDGRNITRAEVNRNQSPSNAGRGVSGSSKKRSLNITVSDHATHIWTERERRKKMRTMFATLHSLLPHLAPKTDKSTIVDEAISYIKSLERSLEVLQNNRLEKGRATGTVEYGPLPLPAESSCAAGAVFDAAVDNWPRTSSHSSMQSRVVDYSLQTWSSPNAVLSVCGEDAQIGICSAHKPGLLTTIFYTLEKHNVDVVTAQISGNSYGCMFMIHARAATSASTEAFKLVIGDLVLYLSS